MSCASIVARARCSALFTAGTDVSRSSAISVACQRRTSRQDQRGALPGRQVLQRSDEREAQGLARDRAVLGQVGVRDRLEPHDFRGDVQVLDHRRAGRAEVHRPGAPLAAAQHVQAHVRRDPVEPRPQRRAPLEPVVGAPGAHHRLLHRVLGLERRRRACGSSRRSAPCGTARAPCRHRPGSPSPPMLLIRARWLDASRRPNSSQVGRQRLDALQDAVADHANLLQRSPVRIVERPADPLHTGCCWTDVVAADRHGDVRPGEGFGIELPWNVVGRVEPELPGERRRPPAQAAVRLLRLQSAPRAGRLPLVGTGAPPSGCARCYRCTRTARSPRHLAPPLD